MILGTIKLKKHLEKDLPEFKIDDINSFPSGGLVKKTSISNEFIRNMIVFNSTSNVTFDTTLIKHVESFIDFYIFASTRPDLDSFDGYEQNSINFSVSKQTVQTYDFNLSNVIDYTDNLVNIDYVNNFHIYGYASFHDNNTTFQRKSNIGDEIHFTSIDHDNGNVSVHLHILNTKESSIKVGLVVIDKDDDVDDYISNIESDAMSYTNTYAQYVVGDLKGTFSSYYRTTSPIDITRYKVVAYMLEPYDQVYKVVNSFVSVSEAVGGGSVFVSS